MTIKAGIDDLAALEDAFGLPRKFIDNLINDDDWSFVIKSHALLESACSDLLCNYFGKSELVNVFSYMDMSNKKSGKIAFISALNLLSKPERRFISELSEIRNELVHNASNVTFSLNNYVSSLTREKQNSLFTGLNLRLESISTETDTIKGLDLLTKKPKNVIWSSLIICLGSIYIQNVFAIKRNELIDCAMKELKESGPIEIKKESLPLTISPRGAR